MILVYNQKLALKPPEAKQRNGVFEGFPRVLAMVWKPRFMPLERDRNHANRCRIEREMSLEKWCVQIALSYSIFG
jgi:hypothetical protein